MRPTSAGTMLPLTVVAGAENSREPARCHLDSDATVARASSTDFR